MRPPGIHNKYVKDKPHVPNQNEIIDTESNLVDKPAITLDGDSYAIKFHDATMETIKDRLFDLLYDVKTEHWRAMETHGVQVYKTEAEINAELSTGGSTLKTEKGYISVRTETRTPKEEELFRVMAYVLLQLPVDKILEKHQVELISRR